MIEKLAGLIPSPRYYAPRIHYRLTHQIANKPPGHWPGKIDGPGAGRLRYPPTLTTPLPQMWQPRPDFPAQSAIPPILLDRLSIMPLYLS